MIELRGVSKQFGSVAAVRNVTFRLEPGEITGLLGPNGAGKTTTIRMATGYLAPSAGQVLIGGVDLAAEPGAGRARLGYLPESTPLYPEMQVEAYIRYRGALAGMGRREAALAAGREIERCLLAGVRRQRVGTLSKGFRQRVGLAGALVHDPEVVILDEPGNGLDPAQIVQFRSVVSELAQKRTMLISSHILAEVERVCSRVLVIAGGELLADGSIATLTRRSGRIVVSCAEGDGARLRSGLESAGWSVQGLKGEPGETRLSVMRVNMTRQKVAEVAAGLGVVLSEVREDQPSLERAFMAILEHANRGGGGE